VNENSKRGADAQEDFPASFTRRTKLSRPSYQSPRTEKMLPFD
jgi:hypothetical protein